MAVESGRNNPPILFSEALGEAKPEDKRPKSCLLWHTYQTRDASGRYGAEHPVPGHIVVKSGEKKSYYAIVCHARHKLEMSGAVELYTSQMRNLNKDGKVGKPLSRSPQTTCVVEYAQMRRKIVGKPYCNNMPARSVCPYFVKMGKPRRLSKAELRSLDDLGCDGASVAEYRAVVRQIRKMG